MSNATQVRKAACSCGQISVTVTGDPVRISVCHCLECQKRTGSLFAAQARWPREHVAIEGRSSMWARTGDEGGTAEFHFCPECSSIVYWLTPAMPETVAVAIGAFADPDFPMPTVAVYNERKHRWLELPDAMDQQF